VYDVGEVKGHHFLMEYVDGENLASLLRRIGRPPRDKAIQLSRQICAGLAPRPGIVLGKALDAGTGRIQVLVMLR
jgi:serine/threonine protein kinase